MINTNSLARSLSTVVFIVIVVCYLSLKDFPIILNKEFVIQLSENSEHEKSFNRHFILNVSSVNMKKYSDASLLPKKLRPDQFLPQTINASTGFDEEVAMLYSENFASNISGFPSGFNLPLNEAKPGSYFWNLYPEQIHLSWTENPHEMRVTWVTYLNLSSLLAFRSDICKKDLLRSTWTMIEAETLEFNEAENLLRIQYRHTAVIKDLHSQCSYEYLVGNGWFWSDIYSFQGKSPYFTSESDHENPSSMIVLGDWGIGILSSYTKSILEGDLRISPVNAILHLGDIAYDLYDLEGSQGDYFLNMIQPLAAKYPYMVLPGNHEIHKNMSHYSTRFLMPKNSENDGRGWFYSFNFGYAHYIMFNTEQYFFARLNDTIETHKNWLLKDLKEADSQRNSTPWIFFFTHRAFYCQVVDRDIECTKEATLLKEEFEELFNRFSVDIVFQAHLHNYERYQAISIENEAIDHELNYYRNPKGPVYLVNGNAGNYEAHNDPVPINLTSPLIFVSEDYGYGRLTVYNKTTVCYQQFSAEQNVEIDYFFLIKDQPN